MDYSPPGSSVHRIPQARILEWVALFSSRESSQPRDWTGVSCIGRWNPYRLNHQGSPLSGHYIIKDMVKDAGEEIPRVRYIWKGPEISRFYPRELGSINLLLCRNLLDPEYWGFYGGFNM